MGLLVKQHYVKIQFYVLWHRLRLRYEKPQNHVHWQGIIIYAKLSKMWHSDVTKSHKWRLNHWLGVSVCSGAVASFAMDIGAFQRLHWVPFVSLADVQRLATHWSYPKGACCFGYVQGQNTDDVKFKHRFRKGWENDKLHSNRSPAWQWHA